MLVYHPYIERIHTQIERIHTQVHSKSFCHIPPFSHLGGASATCVDVSNREIAGYELSVVACYADSINVPSDTTRLENGNLLYYYSFAYFSQLA